MGTELASRPVDLELVAGDRDPAELAAPAKVEVDSRRGHRHLGHVWQRDGLPVLPAAGLGDGHRTEHEPIEPHPELPDASAIQATTTRLLIALIEFMTILPRSAPGAD